MKTFYKSFLITLTIFIGSLQGLKGQSIKLFAGDLLNGAVNGAALGGATMALQNSDDIAPLRVGVGLGVLYGAGIGLYDNSIVPKGQQFYTSGTFNDGRNSTIIVLLDTFYGAAAGATIGGAISLIGNNPVLDGLQYGSGAGAWIGFGFGLIDSFVLAEGPDDLQAYAAKPGVPHAKGIVQLASSSKKMNIGLLNPSIISQKTVDYHSFNTKYAMGLEVVNFNIGF